MKKYVKIIFIFVLRFSLIKNEKNSHNITKRADWSYEGATGPEHWCEISNGCCGKTQSPIDLVHQTITLEAKFNFFGYSAKPQSAFMTNNGHSVSVRFSSDVVPRMSGGGLNGTYFFDSLHLHWGSTDHRGAEHTIAGMEFPMELHLVHYSSQFVSVGEAVASKQPNALAVLGIIFIVRNENKPLSQITDRLKSVMFNGQSTSIDSFPLGSLLPLTTRIFYRYFGSLTTPSCDEVVAWTVFAGFNEMSEDQIRSFRSLCASSEGEEPVVDMSNNYRPVQPLNGRTVSKILGIF